MQVELEHPFEQMAEQIMYARKLPSIEAVIEQALTVMDAGLSEEERSSGLSGMIEAGFESGPSGMSVDEIFDDIFRRLRDSREHEDQAIASSDRAHEAA